MFGLFKRKDAPQGPVDFETTIEIEASAETIYRLIDFADPANQRRALGDRVTDLGDGRAFNLRLADLDDLNFHLEIAEAEPYMSYVYDCVIDPPMGNLITSREAYSIELLDESRCKVTQLTTARFRNGLSLDQFARELTIMSEAVADSQYKLKLHAERGILAVREFEASQQ